MRGSERRVEELYQRGRAELHAYATSLTGDPDAAEDIVQRAFEKTIRTVRNDVQISDLSRWLYRTIHNLAVDHVRVKQRHPTASLSEHPLLGDAQADLRSPLPHQVHLRGRYASIAEALDRLPHGQRKAFLLAEVRGLSYDETAVVMEISIGSVRQFLFRARKFIRSHLEADRLPLLGGLLGLRLRTRADGQAVGLARAAVRMRVATLREWCASMSVRLRDSIAHPALPVVAAAIAAAPFLLLGSSPSDRRGPAGAITGRALAAASQSPPGDRHPQTAESRAGRSEQPAGGQLRASSFLPPRPTAARKPVEDRRQRREDSDQSNDIRESPADGGMTVPGEGDGPLGQIAASGGKRIEPDPSEAVGYVIHEPQEGSIEAEPIRGEVPPGSGGPPGAPTESDASIS